MSLFDFLVPGNYDVVETTQSDSGESIERPLGRGSVSYHDARIWANDVNRIARTSPCREKYEGKTYSVYPSDRERF